MFDKWLKYDIEAAVKKSNRVVISDPHQFLTFMVKELQHYTVLTLNSPTEEMNARLQAMTAHSGSKVIFLCFFAKKDIQQLIEFSGVGGYIDLDNPDQYIRTKLYQEGLGNVTLAESKLLLAAKLSVGKDFKWWKGIVTETINPLDLYEHMTMLIETPTEYEQCHDCDIFSVLRTELFEKMQKPETPVDAPSLVKELAHTIFSRLLDGDINSDLLEIYYWWSNNSALIPKLQTYAQNWALPSNASALTAHIDHPFAALDRQLLVIVGERLQDNATTVDISKAIRDRIESNKASEFKASWLHSLLTLLEFDSSSLYRYDTFAKVTEYYHTKFAALDTAMRHLYGYWYAEPTLLRPLQEMYESHLKSLLDIWYKVGQDNYAPSQLSLIAQALNSSAKVAILVCDGLRLEMAEAIAQQLSATVTVKREIRNAKLPSVTENGMSALFGVDEIVTSTAPRLDKLRQDVPGVEKIDYLKLGDSISADKLVVIFSDIDQVGEKKGLGSLRDIANYEAVLAGAVSRLHRLGYSDVFITADHGFVITGLLDDASKIQAPQNIDGQSVDVKERFFLSDGYLSDLTFIRREDTFPGGRYQYYARTDRPFRTPGSYGYAHGGFTPQECLIPFYCFSTSVATPAIEVKIANRDALADVASQFFTVKLKGNEAAKNKRVKIGLYVNGVFDSPYIIKIDNSGDGSAEFEMVAGNLSIIVQDIESGLQLDSAIVKKSTSRDLDDLF